MTDDPIFGKLSIDASRWTTLNANLNPNSYSEAIVISTNDNSPFLETLEDYFIVRNFTIEYIPPRGIQLLN